jgi:hypothetical protein
MQIYAFFTFTPYFLHLLQLFFIFFALTPWKNRDLVVLYEKSRPDMLGGFPHCMGLPYFISSTKYL